jgi:murein DD-endopeptidase MepM/ murein hydrolase activator NlpD
MWASLGRRARLLAAALAMAGCAVETGSPPVVPRPPSRLVPPPIISGFGAWRGSGGGSGPWQHTGIDIRAALGTPALAAADGTVLHTGRGPLAGRFVIVRHADDLATVYLHLSEVAVTTGQAVSRGTVLGRTGATGNATTPHLHFGVCRRGDGDCGGRVTAGWEDPAAWWVDGNACFVGGRAIPVPPRRLTFPVPCVSSERARDS